jgi:outer membrane protein assembly factor BamE
MRKALILTPLLILSACTGENSLLDRIPDPSDLPLVYKVDVQQGNVVTQDMLAQLQPGMDKTKVRFIMGTPLIVDVFHKNRWDYYYSFSERGGRPVTRHVTLHFKDDLLSYVDGDVRPGSTRVEVPRNRDTSVVVPGTYEESMLDKMKKSVGLGDDKPEAAKETLKAGAEQNVIVPAEAEKEEKGLFKRLLENMGVGDNEDEKEYDTGDTVYKDPTNPDPNSDNR